MTCNGRVVAAWVALTWLSANANATSCFEPEDFCARLAPNMVVFIGKPTSVETGPDRRTRVRFQVLERIWGMDNFGETVSVRGVSFPNTRDALFVAAMIESGGRLWRQDCGPGVVLPAEDPQVRKFRDDVRNRVQAKASLQVLSSYVPVEGATVTLSSAANKFTWNTGSLLARGSQYLPRLIQERLTVTSLPPGTYPVSAERPGFKLDENSRLVSIVPGSCAPVGVTMQSESTVKGQLRGPEGQPLRNTRLHLSGGVRIGGSEYRPSKFTTTDANGYFVFDDVYPGHYYLNTDMSQMNPALGRPLPHLPYPGVFGWRNAEQLVVNESHSLENVVFKLPKLASRTLDVRVTDRAGSPLGGVYVRDGGLSAADDKAANIGDQYVTDRFGRVTVPVWSACNYRLHASRGSQSVTIDVPAGEGAAVVVMRLDEPLAR